MGSRIASLDWKVIKKNRIHSKKKSYGYKERNEEKRKEFNQEIAEYKIEDIVYIDEAGIDDNETYDYAWAPKGQRIYALKNGERSNRLNIIGSLNQNCVLAPFVFEGPCNRDIFETYLSKVLLPNLRPHQIIILDNAAFHKGGSIAKIIEDAQCKLHYLPPYSPDLNPIEHHWFAIKHKMRKNLQNSNHDLYDAALKTFGGTE